MNTLAINTDALHPGLSDAYAEHRRLLWWWAHRVAKAFGGRPSDYIGTLFQRLNYVLHHLDERKGKLVTLFSYRLLSYVGSYWKQYESESWHLYWVKARQPDTSKKDMHVSYAYHEAAFNLYRVPEVDNSEIGDMIDCFESPDDCWRFLARGLPQREAWILEQAFRHQRTLEEIGNCLMVSKERVRQLRNHALGKIGERMRLIRSFACLFREEVVA